MTEQKKPAPKSNNFTAKLDEVQEQLTCMEINLQVIEQKLNTVLLNNVDIIKKIQESALNVNHHSERLSRIKYILYTMTLVVLTLAIIKFV